MATFSAILFLLAGLCLVEAVSLQDARTHIGSTITDLSTRVRPLSHSRSSFGLGAGQEQQQAELLDIVLVASVDGRLHALNRTSGAPLWSMSPDLNGEVPATLGPLVRTQHPKVDPDDVDDDSKDLEVYVIEPQSGEIYVMSSPDAPLQRLPFTMPQLVDMSPFSFSGEGDTRVFVGRKETALLLVELETGRVKATLDSECPWDPFEDLANDVNESEELDLDELDGTKPPRTITKPTEVYIGRTDYHISIRTRPTSPSERRAPVQKLSFSVYGPNKQDGGLQAIYRRTADDTYIESMPNGKVISFRANIVSEDTTVSEPAQALWAHAFPNPIVAVFDVLKSPDREQPFVLLQPRPRLQDILPHDQLTTAAKNNLFPNLEAAYVGLVEETSSLYAMSPDRYPLVIFGDTSRHDVYGVGRSIDPPPDMGWDTEEERDFPPDVDSIAKKTKLKRLCKNGSRDPRCYTGVKPLESSRLSRLLDGVPTVPTPPDISTVVESSSGAGNTSIIPPHAELPGSEPGSGSGYGSEGRGTYASSAVAFLALVVLSVLAWLGLKKRSWSRAGRGEHGVMHHASVPAQNGNGHLHDVVVDGKDGSMQANGDTLITDTKAIAAVSTAIEIAPQPPIPSQIHVPTTAEPPAPTPRKVNLAETLEEAQDAPKPPSTPIPAPRIPDVEDAGEGEESEGDAPATPGRRKPARRKRGKKKKPSAISVRQEGQSTEEKEGEKPQEGHEGGREEEKPLDVAQAAASPSLVVLPPTTPKPVVPSLVVSDEVLGFGSHGTVVFKGALQGRAVAVKRLLQDFVTLAAREVNILQESDDHPNVIRYYYQEHHANFLYIALELCPASLADVIERPDQFRDISIAFDPKKALRQITSGLRHLHALKIVHRDIKPQNILISHAKKGVGESAGHRMLISDFGLCKKLEIDQTSFLPTANGAMAAGTVGWRAPEILGGEVKLYESSDESISSRGSAGTVDGNATPSGRSRRLTKAVDIFALGCLFYYVLTNGGHPFGDRFERESNIMKNAKCLDGLESFGEEGSEAVDLIENMLSPEAQERPDTSTCLLHPYFWDPGKRLNFLQDASDRFENMCRDPRDPNLVELERGAHEIVGADWNARLDKFFIENLGKFRKYDGKSVQDLLRALRNKRHHYQDLPDNVKRQVGPMPEGFLSYFTRRFPRLFLHVHAVIAASSLRSESMFRNYFELTD